MDNKIERALSYADIKVKPHWLRSDNNTFWYRRCVDSKVEFIKVNVETRKREHAFDHELLAKRLSEKKGKKVDPFNLPFPSIDIVGEKVQFHDGGDVWQFEKGELRRSEGKLENQLRSEPWLERSDGAGESTIVTFVNTFTKEVSLEWIDDEGTAFSYGTIAAGESFNQHTYAGHIWRVSDIDKNLIGIYKAATEFSVAILEHASTLGINRNISEERGVVVKGTTVQVNKARGKYELSGVLQEGHKWKEEVDESPDDSFVILWDQRPEQDNPLHLIESSPTGQIQPKLKTVQYLKPGNDVEITRPRLFNTKTQKEIVISNELFSNPFAMTKIGWSKDGSEFRFIYNQRGHKVLRVVGVDTTGRARTIVEETSETFVDYSQKQYYHEIKDTNELIWASERDGWNRLYLVSTQIGLASIRPITPSHQVVVQIDRVDETSRRIWYNVRGAIEGEDPYYDQLARVNFGGSEYVHLTRGNATHDWEWSPDHRFFIDTSSRVDQPPKTIIREGETGQEVLVVEEGNMKELLEAGWTMPERFDAPGRKEDRIYGVIIKPPGFDPSRQYPVIEYIYAGPQEFFVPKSFDTTGLCRELAEIGAVVVIIDGMGTNWRSKAFLDVCYKNLKDGGFPDRIAWMKAAAASRPWMDLERGVGIVGSSAGGQSAMGALLFHNDFYKFAVADSGCHDNRMDKLWWNEQWMGWPVDESYEKSSNVVNASKMEGKLLLLVGEMDDNVDPASTMQVVRALNDAVKHDYELVVFPGKGHGAGFAEAHGKRKIMDFFKQHLLLK